MLYIFAHIDSNILGNIIGSFIAVSGAVGVLFLSEWLRARNTRNQTARNFLREVGYVKEIIKECRKSLERMIEQLSVGTQNLYFSYNSGNILSVSSLEAYRLGLLYNYMTSTQIAKFNSEILTFFGNAQDPIENYVTDQINKWKAGQITNEELYQTFVWIKEKADDAIKFLKDIEKNIAKKVK